MPLDLARGGERITVLCLGAHSDDIEIGAGGLIMTLAGAGVPVHVHWCVLSAAGRREGEARASAEAFLQGIAKPTIEIGNFDDTHFPSQTREIKAWLDHVRQRVSPDIVLVHGSNDAHQDHRVLNDLAWNLFRDHLILEYEIPKWDGDLGRPNTYVALTGTVLTRKVDLLMRHFGSQRPKDWFDPETFRGLARLRGMECRAPERFAEAFTVRKLLLAA